MPVPAGHNAKSSPLSPKPLETKLDTAGASWGRGAQRHTTAFGVVPRQREEEQKAQRASIWCNTEKIQDSGFVAGRTRQCQASAKEAPKTWTRPPWLCRQQPYRELGDAVLCCTRQACPPEPKRAGMGYCSSANKYSSYTGHQLVTNGIMSHKSNNL